MIALKVAKNTSPFITGNLFFVEMSLISFDMLSVNALFTVFYYIISTNVTAPAGEQDRTNDIDRAVGLPFSLCFYLNANTRRVAIGFMKV